MSNICPRRGVGGEFWPPHHKDAPFLIPEPETVTLRGGSGDGEVILEQPGGHAVRTGVLVRGRQEGQTQRRPRGTEERSEWRDLGGAGPAAAGFEGGGRGSGVEECQRLQQLERARKEPFPEGMQPSAPRFQPRGAVQASGLRKCETLNLGCFKPLCLWPCHSCRRRRRSRGGRVQPASASHSAECDSQSRNKLWSIKIAKSD